MAAARGQFEKWQVKSVDVRRQLGMSQDARPWTSRPGVLLRGLAKTPRVLDVLDCCFEHARQQSPLLAIPELIRGLYCNPSQAVDRLPVSRTASTFSSSLSQYSFEKDCLLSSEAGLLFSGWGRRMMPLEVFTEAELSSLCGDCFSVPIPAQVLTAFFLNNHYGVWWR